MKALIICGSRDGGFTSEMCRSFSKGLETNGISSELMFPADMEIKHCTGCGICSKEGKCIFSDDMEKIDRAFGESDVLILATPIHFSGPSSIIKTVIDRFQPIWFEDLDHPVFAAALMSGGSPSPQFTNSISIFKAFSITAGMEWVGHLGITDTDKKEPKDVAAQSYDYGKEISLKLIKDHKLSFGNLYRQPSRPRP